MSVKAMKATVLLGTILGFLLCVIVTYKWPNPSYYLLHTRAWEMMMEGVAFLFPITLKTAHKKFGKRVGLILIIGSYFLISKENSWSGFLAIFPVLGAFLIIQAQRNASFLTNNVVSQKIGAWSYSIYLWHWPFVVAIYYYSLDDRFIYLGIGLSVLLGFLSYKYIEKVKFRNDFGHLFSYLKCIPIYLVAVIGIGGGLTYLNHGFEAHYSSEVKQAANESLNRNPYKCLASILTNENIRPCFIGNKNNVKAIIIGDSHADTLTTSLTHNFNLSSEGIVALTKASCPFILNIKHKRFGEECNEKNIERMKYLNENHKSVK
jgi:hypothetical protein